MVRMNKMSIRVLGFGLIFLVFVIRFVNLFFSVYEIERGLVYFCIGML